MISLLEKVGGGCLRSAARAISLVEKSQCSKDEILNALSGPRAARVIGVTGSPGVGKSTLIDQLVAHYRAARHRVGVLSVDPSSPVTCGAVLGDRVRMMRHATDPDVFIRSLAARGHPGGLSLAVDAAVRILDSAGASIILLETVGIGQVESAVTVVADKTLLLVSPGAGDHVQSLKGGVIELADIIVVNKADLPGGGEMVAEMRFATETRDCPVCLVSASAGDGVADLADAIDACFGLAKGISQTDDVEARGRMSGADAETSRRTSPSAPDLTDHAPLDKRRWQETILNPALLRTAERRAEFKTASGIPVDRLAMPDHPGEQYLDQLGFPGAYPYTRGVQATMYRGRLWTMRQYAGFSTAAETNQRFRYLLSNGTTGLSVAFDLPTQLGYDSDHPLSRGEVGKVGVAIDSLCDMEALFEQIPLDSVSTSMTINSTAMIILAMYVVVAERQGVSPAALSGTLQNDILKEYIARGTHIFPPHPSIRLTTDIIDYCSRELPRFNSISVSGYHIREAGSTAPQEIAFTLANACTYIHAAVQSGLAVDSFAPRLTFFFNASSDFLEEIAKYRAARRIWGRLMRDRFGAQNPASQMLRFHAQTSGYSLAAQQVDNNVVRVALQAMSAVLGGAQSIHTNSRDEALALPTEAAVKLALRTQQVIAYESGVAETVDPLGGGFYIERLTDEIESRTLEILDEIDRQGGMISAIENNWVQEQIDNSAFDYQQQIESGERVVVGVNRFQEAPGEAGQGEVLRIDESIGRLQAEAVCELRRSRDAEAVKRSLSHLELAARGPGNLFPPVLEAVRAYATLGEITDALKNVFGEYR